MLHQNMIDFIQFINIMNHMYLYIYSEMTFISLISYIQAGSPHLYRLPYFFSKSFNRLFSNQKTKL